MSKHTPGPWRTDPDLGHEQVLGPDGIIVADCSIFAMVKNGPTPERNRANARLIAAAPEMLSFLQDLEDALSYEVRKIKESPQESAYNARGLGIALQIVTKKARAVIAKATREEED